MRLRKWEYILELKVNLIKSEIIYQEKIKYEKLDFKAVAKLVNLIRLNYKKI